MINPINGFDLEAQAVLVPETIGEKLAKKISSLIPSFRGSCEVVSRPLPTIAIDMNQVRLVRIEHLCKQQCFEGAMALANEMPESLDKCHLISDLLLMGLVD